MRTSTAIAIVLGFAAAIGATSFVSAQQVTGVTPSNVAQGATTVVVQAQRTRKVSHWFRAESQHFVVYSDTEHKDVTALLGKLERFRYVLRSFSHMSVDDSAKEPKTEIYYLSHEQDLSIGDPDAPAFTIGMYRNCEEGDEAYGVNMYYGANSKLPLEKQPENEGLNYIFQAYARNFFYKHSDMRVPTWFIDGYAQFFSTARFDGNQSVIGLAPEAIGTYLSRLGRDYKYNLDYNDILLGNDSGNNTVGPAAVKTEFEARAWILTHYILSSPDTTAKFHAYMDAMATGSKPLPAFQQAFGYPASNIHNVMFTYMHGKLEAVKLNFKALPEADISFEALPPASEKLLLWQSALKTCPTAKYGATLLKNIRAEAPKYPDSELAQMTLARAEVLSGDPAAVLPALQKTVHDTPGDFEAQYLLGRAELALGAKTSGDERTRHLNAAYKAFLTASDLDPLSAANAYYFYRTQVLRDGTPNEDGEGAALLASQLAPEVDAYQFHAGLIYAKMGRRDEALRALHIVADNPRGSSWKVLAKTWIAKIDGGAWEDSIVTAMKADYPQLLGGAGDWTIATADVVQAVEDAASAEDAAGMGISVGDTSADPGTTTN